MWPSCVAVVLFVLVISGTYSHHHHTERRQAPSQRPTNNRDQILAEGVRMSVEAVTGGRYRGRGGDSRAFGVENRGTGGQRGQVAPAVRHQDRPVDLSVAPSHDREPVVVFPTSRPFTRPTRIQSLTPTPSTRTQQSTGKIEIPVSLFRNKSINTFDDWVNNFGVKQAPASPVGFAIASVFGSRRPTKNQTDNPELLLRANSASVVGGVRFAAIAPCEPSKVPVELEKPSDPAVLYFPMCTKLERCGGCCPHASLVCEPTIVEKVDVTVRKMKFIPESGQFMYEGPETFVMDKHIECGCNCRVKEEHCTDLQEYRENECRCVCTNEQEAGDCTGRNKFWDADTCSCACRDEVDCSTGFFFDLETCSCQPEKSNSVVFPSVRSDVRFRLLNPYEDGMQGDQPTESTPEPWYKRWLST